MIQDLRQQQLTDWLQQQVNLTKLQSIINDASFRRYFRVYTNTKTFIAMDAPPEHENCDAFVHVANLLRQGNILAPEIFAGNLQQGFLLLTDFGDQLLLSLLNQQNVSEYYLKAMDILLQVQQIATHSLQSFAKEKIQFELKLFSQWFLQGLLNYQITAEEKAILETTFEKLTENALEQPQVFMHKDFHSRNLLVTEDNQLAVLDFQDALIGPITYDLVSLLKDCYIAWPRALVENWVQLFYKQLNLTISQQQFLKWFDVMGLQRHIKVLGIFSRLNIRDHKANYLNDIPRVFDYILEVTQLYPEFASFNRFLRSCVQPKLDEVLV